MAHDTATLNLMDTVARPFSNAIAMPPSVYTSDAFLEHELNDLFRSEWICVGRAEALAEPGDFITYDLVDQPVVILRDEHGELRALSNVCLHRMSVLLEGCGNVQRIKCPYHAWTYSLNGELRAAPFMKETPGFKQPEYRLPEIRCEQWMGWIYITLNDEIPSVRERLGDLESLIAHYHVEDYRQTFYETHVWNTNWKVLAENFMESYHLPACHEATVGPHSAIKDMDCPPGFAHFNYHWITKEASLAIGNAHPDNDRLTGDWRKTTALIAIYPNHFITLTPGYFWYLTLHPRGVDQVHITYGGGLSPEFMADPKAQEYQTTLKNLLDEVNVEDRCCTERVYRGLSSPAARPGNISYLERPVYDFAQYIAERIGGFERRFDESGSAAT